MKNNRVKDFNTFINEMKNAKIKADIDTKGDVVGAWESDILPAITDAKCTVTSAQVKSNDYDGAVWAYISYVDLNGKQHEMEVTLNMKDGYNYISVGGGKTEKFDAESGYLPLEGLYDVVHRECKK